MRDERIRQYQRLLRLVAIRISIEHKEGITIELMKSLISREFKCLPRTAERHINIMKELRLIHFDNQIIKIDYNNGV